MGVNSSMPNLKEVVFFTSNLGGGGAEGVCVKVANALSSEGWKVTVLVQNLDNDQLSQKLNEKVSIESLNCTSIRHGLWILREWILTHKPLQVVTFHYMLTTALVLVRHSLVLQHKFRIISRNINTISKIKQHSQQEGRPVLQEYLRDLLYTQSDLIIHQCQGMCDDFVSHYPSTKEKCVVIYNPSVDNLEPFAKHLPIPDDKRYFLFAGRLESQKSVDCALRAFARFCKDDPAIRFRIVGDGSQRTELEQLCRDLQIEDRVDFFGFSREIESHFASALCTVLSSQYEGFPNVLVESISFGTPVVSFDCPSGPAEIIIEGVNGFLAEYQNEDDLYEKMKMASTTSFSYQTVKDTVQRFSIAKIASEWDALLSSQLS